MKKLIIAIMVMFMVTSAQAIKKKSSGKTGPFFECYTMEKYDGIEDAVQVRIAGGPETGFYFGGGKRLVTVMGMNTSRNAHWGCSEINTGSQGNIDAIEDGVANAGWIQGNDELRLYTDKKYESFMTGKVILPTYQTEAVLMVMPKGYDEDNLEDKNVRVYIGSKSSGNLGVLNHLKMLNTDMKNVQPVSYEELFGEDSETDDYFGPEILDMLAQKKFNAILKVTVIKPGSKFIKRVIDHKQIDFVSVNDSSFDNKVKIDGKKIQIFTLEKVILDFDGWNTKVETPVMPIKLLVDKANMNPKAYRKLRDALEYTNFKPFGLK